MRIIRVLILMLLALAPLATLVHPDDLGHWDVQRSAMAAPDEFSYLLMAQNLLHGGGLSLKQALGQDTFYPPGYPLLLAACAKCVHDGILTPFAAHVLNALLLSADIVIVYFLSKRLLLLLTAEDHRRFALSPAAAANFALLITAAFTLNWHVMTLPLLVMSEPAFMLASFAWLAMALRWPDWHRTPAQAAVIALLAVIAWSMRAAGITCIAATILFPLIAWWRNRRCPAPPAPATSRRLAALAIVVTLPLLYQLALHATSPEKSLAAGDSSANSYTQQLVGGIADRKLPLTIFSHLEDFASSFVPELREDPAIVIRGIAGKSFLTLALIAWAAHALYSLRRPAARSAPSLGILHLYLAFYIGLYLLWPFNAARFWTPILPIMLVYAACALLDFGSLLHKIPRLALATAAVSLLLLLHVEEDFLELGIRARRLNYVSDSIDDSVRAILRQSPDPSTTLVAGMGADERFMMGWYFGQERPNGNLPELRAGTRNEHADAMLLHLLSDQPTGEPRPIFFVSYFPVGQQGIDTRAALAAVASRRPHARITKIFQKEIVITVWRIDP